MMTPNDVAQHRFTTARFNGYNTADVDDFLDQLTSDYTALYKENAVLKSKMKVLVDKISEYRATEDDMRMTLLTARKASDRILAEAEEKRDEMIKEAEAEVADHRAELRREIENSEAQLDAARKSTLDFAAGMRGLVAQQQAFLDQQVEFLNRLSEIEAAEKPAEEPVEEPQPEEDPLEKVLADDELAAQIDAAAAAAEAAPEAAYEQDLPDLNSMVDEADATRIMDLDSAGDQDYRF